MTLKIIKKYSIYTSHYMYLQLPSGAVETIKISKDDYDAIPRGTYEVSELENV